MKRSLKDQVAAAVSIHVKSEIQKIFDQYKRHMSGKIIETPVPESVHLCDENFPHWIKLERQNPETGRWEEAYSEIVVPYCWQGNAVTTNTVWPIRDALQHCPTFLTYCKDQTKSVGGKMATTSIFKNTVITIRLPLLDGTSTLER